jgi:cellobiose phosphorylase
MLPMIWSDPALARDVIEYSAEEQPAGTGAVPYGMLSLCRRFDLGTSDDMDQWLLWAASEYVLATRDLAFLKQEVPYWGVPCLGPSGIT